MDLTEVSDKDTEETLSQAAKAYLEYVKRDSEEKSVVCDDGKPESKKPKLEFDLSQFLRRAPVQIEKMKVYNLCAEGEEVESHSSREEMEPISDGSSSPPSVSDNGHLQSNLSPNRSPTFLEDVLNAVGHPNVLKQIALQFLNNVKQRNSSD